MSESGVTFEEEPLTTKEHMDPDKHWIGESLPAPSPGDIASVIGTSASATGSSPFPARADHTHDIGPGVITGVELADNAVQARHIAPETIQAGDIAADSIGSSELQNNCIFSTHINNDAVGTTEIAANAVTTAKILNGNVTSAKLEDNVTVSTTLQCGGAALSDTQGFQALSTGRVGSTTTIIGSPNLRLSRHTGGAVNVGEDYVIFIRSAAGVGTIAIASSTTVSYNTSCDEDKKNILAILPFDKAVEVLRIIQPLVFAWKEDTEQREVIGYTAQRVYEAWPDSLRYGLVSKPHLTEEGDEVGWMMDFSKLIPLLHAGWVAHDVRLAKIEQVLRLL